MKKNKVGGLTKQYGVNRQKDQQNRMETPTDNKLMKKVQRQFTREKDSFQQMVLKYLDIRMQRKYTSIYTSYLIKKLIQVVSET